MTPDAVLALAPDERSVRAASAIAAPRRWRSLLADEGLLWGEVQGTDLYRVGVVMEIPAFSCTCPSSKVPCKHGLALLLAYARSPEAFARAAAPDWLVELRERRARRAARGGAIADPEAQARRAETREARIAAGLEELERWLRDLLRSGLAAVHGRGYAFWDAPAARLVDAQIPGFARRVRALAGVSASGTGWEERLVERLGLLWLLAQAYRRQAELPPELRADVRSFAGWTVSQEELLAGPAVSDEWLVLGSRVEEDERYQSGRLWLWGKHSERPALLLSSAGAGAPLDLGGRVGTTLDADLVFYPGARPVRALVQQRRGARDGIGEMPGHADLVAAHAAYGDALARNAWADELPLALRAVTPQRLGEAWVLRDGAGRFVPLSRRFDGELRLAALAGGRPVGVFGEWGGRAFWPLGVHAEGRYVSLG